MPTLPLLRTRTRALFVISFCTDGGNGFTNGNNEDQVGTIASPINAQLGSLTNNGGPTLTHALLSNSPALDAGDNCVTDAAHCGDANLPQLLTDQRGTISIESLTDLTPTKRAATYISALGCPRYRTLPGGKIPCRLICDLDSQVICVCCLF